MLLHDDLRLDAVIRDLVSAMSYTRAHFVYSKLDGMPSVPAALLEDIHHKLTGCQNALTLRIKELLRWGEDELANRMGELTNDVAKLCSRTALSPTSLDKLSDCLNRAIAMQGEIALIAPLEQSPAAASSVAGNETVDQLHEGCALAIAFSRDRNQLWDRTLFRPLRREISDARGLRLMYDASRFGEGRIACYFLYERAGSKRRTLVHADGERLIDAAGRPLDWDCQSRTAGSPGPTHGIGYFFIPQPEQPSLLTRLLRLTWTLAALSDYGLKFKIVAAPAALAWREADQRATTGLRLTEGHAIFDLLPELIEDPSLDNMLIVHPTLRETKSKTKQWFTPSWRLPYDKRAGSSAADEWLWTTPSFRGLPGSLCGPDLMAASSLPVLYESGSDRDAARSRARTNAALAGAVDKRRAPARIYLRRPLYCSLLLRDGHGRQAPLPAYMLEYSALSCRVQLRASDAREAEAIQRQIEQGGPPDLVVPEGLYWPWPAEALSPLGPEPRPVMIAPTDGPRTDRWTHYASVAHSTKSSRLELRLLYRRRETGGPSI